MNSYEQAEYFGIKNRLIKLSEECSELAQAATKYHEVIEFGNREQSGYIEHIIEEMADVYLLCSEVRHLLDIEMDAIIPIIQHKLERTDGIIKERTNVEDYYSITEIEKFIKELKVGSTDEACAALDLLLNNIRRDSNER